MKVKFFASLKDFFGIEMILEVKPATVSELYMILVKLKPESEDLLKKCRFAINNSFVPINTSLENTDEVLAMPPSSGG